jgi:GTP-binding protein LepA
VINKVDLPSADVERVREQIEQVIGIDAAGAVLTSAKTGLGVDELLERIVTDVPPPKGDPEAPLKALLFDSWYDVYRGVVCFVRVVDGVLRRGDKIQFVATGRIYTVEELGTYHPKPRAVEALGPGEVGYVYANIKDLIQAKIGDTVTHPDRPTTEACPGFQEVKPMVFAGLFPVVSEDYEDLRDAVDKLRLNDASFTFEPRARWRSASASAAASSGCCTWRSSRSGSSASSTSLITTAPGVRYRVHTSNGEVVEISSPAQLPDLSKVEAIEEPYIRSTIVTRDELRRWHPGAGPGPARHSARPAVRVDRPRPVEYDFPLAEVIHDFYDKLKSVSRGYASFDYELADYRRATS